MSTLSALCAGLRTCLLRGQALKFDHSLPAQSPLSYGCENGNCGNRWEGDERDEREGQEGQEVRSGR